MPRAGRWKKLDERYPEMEDDQRSDMEYGQSWKMPRDGRCPEKIWIWICWKMEDAQRSDMVGLPELEYAIMRL